MADPSTPTQHAHRAPDRIRRILGFPRWAVALTAIAVVLAGLTGWALASVLAPDGRTDHQPAAESLTAEQARAQACNAFRVASRQWMDAYRQWLPAVTAPGWHWGDPAVQAATERFSEVEAEVTSQLDGLIPPNTPLEVAQAIRGYTGALLEYSAGHLMAGQAEMDAQETAIDDAADDVGRVCGQP